MLSALKKLGKRKGGPMDARIRFGNELDIFRRVDPDYEGEPSRTVLSFSKRVRSLPDEPEFAGIMDNLELRYEVEGSSKEFEIVDGDLVEHGNRLVEIDLPVGRTEILRMGKGLVRLAKQKGRLGSNDVLFIDHTIDPAGRILDDFDALLNAVREERLKEELRSVYGMDEAEIRQFFRDFGTEVT